MQEKVDTIRGEISFIEKRQLDALGQGPSPQILDSRIEDTKISIKECQEEMGRTIELVNEKFQGFENSVDDVKRSLLSSERNLQKTEREI